VRDRIVSGLTKEIFSRRGGGTVSGIRNCILEAFRRRRGMGASITGDLAGLGHFLLLVGRGIVKIKTLKAIEREVILHKEASRSYRRWREAREEEENS